MATPEELKALQKEAAALRAHKAHGTEMESAAKSAAATLEAKLNPPAEKTVSTTQEAATAAPKVSTWGKMKGFFGKMFGSSPDKDLMKAEMADLAKREAADKAKGLMLSPAEARQSARIAQREAMAALPIDVQEKAFGKDAAAVAKTERQRAEQKRENEAVAAREYLAENPLKAEPKAEKMTKEQRDAEKNIKQGNEAFLNLTSKYNPEEIIKKANALEARKAEAVKERRIALARKIAGFGVSGATAIGKGAKFLREKTKHGPTVGETAMGAAALGVGGVMAAAEGMKRMGKAAVEADFHGMGMKMVDKTLDAGMAVGKGAAKLGKGAVERSAPILSSALAGIRRGAGAAAEGAKHIGKAAVEADLHGMGMKMVDKTLDAGMAVGKGGTKLVKGTVELGGKALRGGAGAVATGADKLISAAEWTRDTALTAAAHAPGMRTAGKVADTFLTQAGKLPERLVAAPGVAKDLVVRGAQAIKGKMQTERPVARDMENAAWVKELSKKRIDTSGQGTVREIEDADEADVIAEDEAPDEMAVVRGIVQETAAKRPPAPPEGALEESLETTFGKGRPAAEVLKGETMSLLDLRNTNKEAFKSEMKFLRKFASGHRKADKKHGNWTKADAQAVLDGVRAAHKEAA